MKDRQHLLVDILGPCERQETEEFSRWGHMGTKVEKHGACARIFKGVSCVPVIKSMKVNGTKDLNGNWERTMADVK